MATFKPVSRNIATTPENVAQYLAYLEELSKLRRPTDVAMGFETDKAPMAFELPQARGVSQITPGTQIQTPITPTQAVAPVYQAQQQPGLPTISVQELTKRSSDKSSPSVQNTTQDGGVVLSNGQVYYPDGTWRETQQSPRIQAPEIITDFGNGRALYNDGKVRVTGNIQATDVQGKTVGGIKAIVELLFPNGGLRESGYYPGTNINQYFGENAGNSALGYGAMGHRGTDIASGVQPIFMPFSGKVVQILRDDGTRWGTYSGHQGFGNSILIQTNDGKYIRVSHLSQINVEPGQTLNSGAQLGITGSTGNSSGNHTDVMTFDENMNVINPDNFFATTTVADKQIGQEIPRNEQSSYETLKQENYARTGSPDVSYQGETKSLEGLQSLTGALAGTQKPQSLAGDIIGGIGSVTGSPALGLSELASGDVLGATKELSGTIAQTGRERGLPEYGISESVTGLGNILGKAQETGKNLLQGILGTQGSTAEQDITKQISQGLDIKSKLDQAKGLLSQVNNLQPGNLGKTAVQGLSGIVQKGFNQPVNPVPADKTTPVGQTGYAGNVLVSGVAPSQQRSIQPTAPEQKAQTPLPYTQPTKNIYDMSGQASTGQASGAKPSSQSSQKSSSSQKSTTKTTAQTKQPTQPVKQPVKTQQKSQQISYAKPVYAPAKATVKPAAKVPEAVKKTATTALKTVAKTAAKSVFKKAVSAVKSLFKKK